jgi:hypothetical protein
MHSDTLNPREPWVPTEWPSCGPGFNFIISGYLFYARYHDIPKERQKSTDSAWAAHNLGMETNTGRNSNKTGSQTLSHPGVREPRGGELSSSRAGEGQLLRRCSFKD